MNKEANLELIKQKQCSKCHKLKPLSQFYKQSNRKDGHQNQCKNCQYEIWKSNRPIYYQANKEKYLKYSEDYRLRNKDTEKYKKRKREDSKRWRKENPAKAKINARKGCRKYRILNTEKIKIYMKAWRQTPEGKISNIMAKQKKRLLSKSCIINDLTAKQIQILLEKAKRCAICRKHFNKNRKRTLDHIIPLSKNGNNTLMNIQVVCAKCNGKKSTKNYTEFNGGQILIFV